MPIMVLKYTKKRRYQKGTASKCFDFGRKFLAKYMLAQTAGMEQWTRLHFRHVPDACLFAYFLCRGEPIWLLIRLTQCGASHGWPVEHVQ